MAPTETVPTTTLNDRTVVLAKPDGSAQSFANRTQATRCAETLRLAGGDAEVHEPRSPSRSWYVRVAPPMERSAEILDTANGECRKTGEGAVFIGEEECEKHLADLRRLNAGEDSRFVVDWHDAAGDLLETFNLDEVGFEALIGHAPKTPAEYAAFDNTYWEEARAARRAS